MPRHTLLSPFAHCLIVFAVPVFLSACGDEAPQQSTTAKNGAAVQSGPTAQGARNRPQPVTTTTSQVTDVPIVLTAQGNVVPLDEVDVRAQITGTVAAIHFREGDNVKLGQLLFTLDNREDAAAVRRSEAAVAGARAQLDIAERDYQRTQDLSSKNFVSSAALDAARNKVDSARATLLQSQAALEEAKVALSYSSIRAPFDGRAGRLDVRVGSLVTNTTSMVKVTRMSPIGVSFTLPERDLAGLLTAQRKRAVPVEVDVGNGRSLKGEVSFIDSSVDSVAGTISIKARIENEARALWPGQFVTVKIVAGELANAVVLPTQAVVNGPNGRFVYRVNPDSTVAQHPVEVLRVADQQAVVKGLESGVKVVLEGGQNLRPGGKIEEVKPTAPMGRRNGAAEAQSAPISGARKGFRNGTGNNVTNGAANSATSETESRPRSQRRNAAQSGAVAP